MSDEWYCKTESQEFGPMTSKALRKLAAKGALKREDVVKRGEKGHWRPASKVKGLFPDVVDRPDNSATGAVVNEKITEKPSSKRRKKNATENKDAAKQNGEYVLADRITRVANRIFKLIGIVIPIGFIVVFLALASYQPINKYWKYWDEFYGQDGDIHQKLGLLDEIVFYSLAGAVALIWIVRAVRRSRIGLSGQYSETKARKEAKDFLERQQKQGDYPEEPADVATRDDTSAAPQASLEERSVSFRFRWAGGGLGFVIGMIVAGISKGAIANVGNITLSFGETALLYLVVPMLIIVGAIFGAASAYSTRRNQQGVWEFRKTIKLVGIPVWNRSTPLGADPRLFIRFDKTQETIDKAVGILSPAAMMVQSSTKQRHIIVELCNDNQADLFQVLKGAYSERKSWFFYTGQIELSADKVAARISEGLGIPLFDHRD